MPFSLALAILLSLSEACGEIGPERVGTARGDAATQLHRPATLAAELGAPRPEPARREVERVLVREADRAMHLVHEAGRNARGFADPHLGDGDLEARV